MAATAGGVAVGSAVGHVVGAGMTSMFSGGSSATPAAAAPSAPVAAAPTPPAEPTGPCAFEIKEFIKCAQGQADLTLCQGFNEAVKECKSRNSLAV